MRNTVSWIVAITLLPLTLIIYLIHRTIDLIFGGIGVVADGLDRAINLCNKLPGGLA